MVNKIKISEIKDDHNTKDQRDRPLMEEKNNDDLLDALKNNLSSEEGN